MLIVEILVYIAIFIGLYFAIFIFGALFEYKNEIYYKSRKKFLPRVSLIVPCFNEEENIEKTLNSIINLEYPQEKIEVIVIDDGSCDKTLEKINQFQRSHPFIKTFHKENGGKYTALNLGLQKATSPYIGTVDADSFLHPESLEKAMAIFENRKVMAVVSTIKIQNPKNILEGVQYIEYLMVSFLKKIFSFLNGVNVVPGPLSIFNRKVFDKIGNYKKAHQGEDLEMAFRMQKANMKIAHAIDAIVYTNACSTLKEITKQRLRWNRAAILNLKDYPELLNPQKHGNLAFLLLTSVAASVITVALFLFGIYNFFYFIHTVANQFILAGTDFFRPIFTFSFPDWTMLAITPIYIFATVILAIFFAYIFLSKKFTKEEKIQKKNVVFYLIIFPYLNAIFWLVAFGMIIFKRKELAWK